MSFENPIYNHAESADVESAERFKDVTLPGWNRLDDEYWLGPSQGIPDWYKQEAGESGTQLADDWELPGVASISENGKTIFRPVRFTNKETYVFIGNDRFETPNDAGMAAERKLKSFSLSSNREQALTELQ